MIIKKMDRDRADRQLEQLSSSEIQKITGKSGSPHEKTQKRGRPSLADSEVTPIDGARAMDVLSKIQGCTYEREDLGQGRVCLIADEVHEAIEQLAIDNVVSSKFHNGDQYKTLDYSRLICLAIPAISELSKQVQDLHNKLNGSASQPR